MREAIRPAAKRSKIAVAIRPPVFVPVDVSAGEDEVPGFTGAGSLRLSSVSGSPENTVDVVNESALFSAHTQFRPSGAAARLRYEPANFGANTRNDSGCCAPGALLTS